MREYAAPIYSLENDEVVGTLTFTAKNFDEADQTVDRWNMQHLGEGYTASSLDMSWKKVEMSPMGDIRLA